MARIETKSKSAKRKTAIIAGISIFCFCAVVVIAFITLILPKIKYNAAVKLMNDGKYDEAAAAFEALNGYQDSDSLITECRYGSAVSLMDNGKYDDAIILFGELNGFNDSLSQIEKCRAALTEAKYNTAVDSLNAGNIIEAYESFVSLKDYKDSKSKADGIFDLYKEKKNETPVVGDVVFFGSYEQNNDLSDGKEDIEWCVLAKEDGKMLVISKYVLDNKPYNSSDSDITWETSIAKSWLNGVFLNFSFTAEERDKMFVPERPESVSENTVTDKIFLLSVDEVDKYFIDNAARQCFPTPYAVSQGIYTSKNYKSDGESTCRWWLRSSAIGNGFSAYVDNSGSVYYATSNFIDVQTGLRPAVWIDINLK